VLVLTVVIVAALFFFAVIVNWRTDDSQPRTAEEPYVTDSIAAVDAVSAFALFVAEQRATRDATLDHAYTAEGLRRLAAALYIIPDRERGYAPRRYASAAADLLEAANTIQEAPLGTDHADMVRAAALSASAALMDIQRARYPDLAGAVTELGQAAKAIRADQVLLDQTDVIQQFFDRASDVLRAIVAIGL
jgi:hypothetical protein